MSSTCSPLIQSVMDTAGAALSVLPQMHDRGSAGDTVILYNMQHKCPKFVLHRFVHIYMGSTCNSLIQGFMDTPGAFLCVLLQIHNRGSAGNAVILYTMPKILPTLSISR
jgi:hypothetical protein